MIYLFGTIEVQIVCLPLLHNINLSLKWNLILPLFFRFLRFYLLKTLLASSAAVENNELRNEIDNKVLVL